ncbi:DNA integrity scanning diadenylate cyclase DisA [Naumannella halotolerans]|uniref:Diadenylate cyclase n=1 Tax=Naumannella halotolerans TaxID=993414 RepID=A0A4R7IYV5_9ACTN|nr:DNA integrity scanning diadenylate cyclase DisA [Naumannella halotolerans]TDT29971.1 diadenylate cyclase [Naumannella halotolerans]
MESPVDTETLHRHLAMLAPGTALRDGIDRILSGRTGALIVLGNTRQVEQVSTGGFQIDVPFVPTKLRELAKMDGAIVLSGDAERIITAGVHLMPDAGFPTEETGTRHRTADRVSQQTGKPVISVSAALSTITLFLRGTRRVLERSEVLLGRANLAVQTMERYRTRLFEQTDRLSGLEIRDQVTVKDVVGLAQRLEMIRRLDAETIGYVIELGTLGRLPDLQRQELSAGTTEIGQLLVMDYPPPGGESPSLESLATLTDAELLEPQLIARTLGFGGNEHLDAKLRTKGHRQLAQITRLPAAYSTRLIDHFGDLQHLFAASITDLLQVEGIGENRANLIRDGLARIAEASYSDAAD